MHSPTASRPFFPHASIRRRKRSRWMARRAPGAGSNGRLRIRDDREARSEMMMAGIQGGLAFQKGLGAVHALSHPLGALTEPMLHHGTLNAVILPLVLRFNAGYVGDKYQRLRRALGLAEDADLADAVAARNVRIGMPASLREMQVPPRGDRPRRRRRAGRPFVAYQSQADDGRGPAGGVSCRLWLTGDDMNRPTPAGSRSSMPPVRTIVRIPARCW